MSSNKLKYNIIDLFCGAGGFSYGFNTSGFKTLLAIDNSKTCIDTYSFNHKPYKSIYGDICKVSNIDVKKIIGDNKVDVIIGGPPCQGFSSAGKRDPLDPRNSLFMEFVRFVKLLKPKYFVIENVRGILTMKTKCQHLIIQNHY